MSIRPSFKSLGSAVVFLCVVGFTVPASAGPVTWAFEGEVTSILDPLSMLPKDVGVGALFSGTLTFDPSADDVRPLITDIGFYENAILGVEGYVGAHPFSFTTSDRNSLKVFDSVLDSFLVQTDVDFLGQQLIFQVSLGSGSSDIFPSIALPVLPPDLGGFAWTTFSLGNESEVKPLSIHGTITSTVPEPTTALLCGIGLAFVGGARVATRASWHRIRSNQEETI